MWPLLLSVHTSTASHQPVIVEAVSRHGCGLFGRTARVPATPLCSGLSEARGPSSSETTDICKQQAKIATRRAPTATRRPVIERRNSSYPQLFQRGSLLYHPGIVWSAEHPQGMHAWQFIDSPGVTAASGSSTSQRKWNHLKDHDVSWRLENTLRLS